MKYSSWAEVLEKKYDALIDEALEIGKMAIRNKHLRYIIQIDLNGEIHSWYEPSCGSSSSNAVREGKAIEVFTINYMYLDERKYYKEEDEENGGLNLEDSMDEYINSIAYYFYNNYLSGLINYYANYFKK